MLPQNRTGARAALSPGCIIADSVGLGKTFEALAIIKHHELRNDRVLVLVPKRLRDNWTLYIRADLQPLWHRRPSSPHGSSRLETPGRGVRAIGIALALTMVFVFVAFMRQRPA